MNIGLYQSASALTALERWQDSVSQNITSSQTVGYRKRTVSFSTQEAGELQIDPKGRVGHGSGMPMLFPSVISGISFQGGETQPTRRELDVAIQGEGFFEIQRPDGSKMYTRGGEFRLRPDRTLVSTAGEEVLNEAGQPITLLPGGGSIVINQNGTIVQGETTLGKLSVQKFPAGVQLLPTAGGAFMAPPGVTPQQSEDAVVLQGYVEGSNVTPLREMVDLVIISRAYEANQKIITSVDQQMQKTLDALG